MTNEEAKELLKEEFEILKSGIDTADWESPNEELAKIIEANTMAIKALEQQPCEDAISRSALLEELGEEPFNWNDSPEAIQEVSDYQWFRSLVENAQPVTPKVEPCDDYISREAAMEEFEQYGENRNSKMYIDTIMDILADLPSVTPKSETITDFADRCRECGAKYGKLLKSKTGSWIVHPKGGCAHLVCSKCLSDAPFDCKTNFCPNCGCRMIKPQESESDD